MTRKLVQLGRTFLDVSKSDDGLDSANLALFASAFGKTIHWADLLEHDCTVVLGEAGTGKTTEFRQRVDLLVADGNYAFFLSIEDLAQTGIEKSLRAADRKVFTAWRASETHAYFFLDSLDEARLRGHRFTSALRNLEAELGKDFARARIVLSSRVSDWRADADLDALQAILPTRKKKTDDDGDRRIRVVALAPLNEAQVQALTKAFGVGDLEAFTAAISKASAQVFIERPRDVEWLASYWRSHGRLGSLRELVEHNVDQKLRERNLDRRPLLSTVEARKGAVALAGLATLAKRASFLLPDESVDPERSVGSLDPLDLLTDWSNLQIEDLLTRPLFDEATYGRVRIHHRTSQEYLTAEWLSLLLQRGLQRSKLEEIIFRDGTDGEVVAPEMMGAAAWLALRDEQLRDRLIAVAPHILIDEGDPNGLPVAVRSDLLRAYAKQFEGRARLFHSFDKVGLGRFAAAELAETINELFASNGEAEELRETLLGIVSEGGITACAKAAFSVAMDDTAPGRLRAAAIRAVGAAGSVSQKTKIISVVASTPKVDQDIGGALVGAMYPDPLDVDALLTLLQNVQPKPENTLTALAYLLGHQVPDDTVDTERTKLVPLVPDPRNRMIS